MGAGSSQRVWKGTPVCNTQSYQQMALTSGASPRWTSLTQDLVCPVQAGGGMLTEPAGSPWARQVERSRPSVQDRLNLRGQDHDDHPNIPAWAEGSLPGTGA